MSNVIERDDGDYYYFLVQGERGGDTVQALSQIPTTILLRRQVTYRHIRRSIRGKLRGDYRFRIDPNHDCVWQFKQERYIVLQRDADIKGEGTHDSPYLLFVKFVDQMEDRDPEAWLTLPPMPDE